VFIEKESAAVTCHHHRRRYRCRRSFKKNSFCVSNRIGNNQQRTWMQASHVIEEGHAIPTWGAGRVRGEEG
jgi:hypothetical protein